MARHIWAPGEREQLHARAVKMREEDCYVTEIQEALGIQKSTAYEWTKDVKVDPEIERKRHERLKRERGANVYIGHMNNCDQERRENYQRGKASELTDEDLYCIGQYGGEGQKARNNGVWSLGWVVVNADFEFIRRMIGYAIRAGQKPLGFRATIHVHEDLEASDDEVKAYWSKAGIPVEKIGILRIKSKRKSQKAGRTLTWGTCRLEPIDNGVPLFWYWCGQYDQLLERSGGQPEFLPLLDKLRDEERQRTEDYLAKKKASEAPAT